MHESPQVLPWEKPRTGLVLAEGMVLTVEPMINQTPHAVQTDDKNSELNQRAG